MYLSNLSFVFAKRICPNCQIYLSEALPLNPLLVPTHQGHISEVRSLPQLLESQGDVVLKVVPFQMELLWGRHFRLMLLSLLTVVRVMWET